MRWQRCAALHVIASHIKRCAVSQALSTEQGGSQSMAAGQTSGMPHAWQSLSMNTGCQPTVIQQFPHLAAQGCRGAAGSHLRPLLVPPQPAARATLQPRNSASAVVSAQLAADNARHVRSASREQTARPVQVRTLVQCKTVESQYVPWRGACCDAAAAATTRRVTAATPPSPPGAFL